MKNALSSRESGRGSVFTSASCVRLAFLTVLVVATASSGVVAEGPGGLLPPLYDAGDYRWYFDEKVPMLRVANEFVVGLAGGADGGSVIDALTGEGKPLEGFRAERKYRKNLLTFVSPLVETSALEDALTVAADYAGVEWTSPVFWDTESGMHVIMSNEVIVALDMARDSMDLTAQEVLEGILERDVISYRRASGTPDHFILKIPEGGTGALAAAERYAALDIVRWAEPNAYVGARACAPYTPNDTVFANPVGSPAGPVIPSGSTVPEPGSALILLLGFAGATLRRRKQ